MVPYSLSSRYLSCATPSAIFLKHSETLQAFSWSVHVHLTLLIIFTTFTLCELLLTEHALCIRLLLVLVNYFQNFAGFLFYLFLVVHVTLRLCTDICLLFFMYRS